MLETEPNLHHRIDLFFLVDSITQRSHCQKGIAAAAYIPTVQAALPRLLGAAAPHGAAGQENRRQCLKVLRIWLQRKVLPGSLLCHYINAIVNSDEHLHVGPFHSLSRDERSIDDPIRYMHDMIVDEHGSNFTVEFAGILPSAIPDEEHDNCNNVCKNNEGLHLSKDVGCEEIEMEISASSEPPPIPVHSPPLLPPPLVPPHLPSFIK